MSIIIATIKTQNKIYRQNLSNRILTIMGNLELEHLIPNQFVNQYITTILKNQIYNRKIIVKIFIIEFITINHMILMNNKTIKGSIVSKLINPIKIINQITHQILITMKFNEKDIRVTINNLIPIILRTIEIIIILMTHNSIFLLNSSIFNKT